jgi:uncharacterized protein
MIAPDANLFIYALDPISPFHRKSRQWLESALSSTQEPIGIPALSVYGLIRFVTNPRLAPTPLSFKQATAIIDSWLELPHVQILYPGNRHWSLLKQLGAETRATGNFTTDVALAAIATEHGAIVYTNDRDFARFPNVRWHNPLQP